MKSLVDKIFAEDSPFEWLFLAVPFVLWIFCFLQFFTGHLPLYEDAISYADHIRFYTDSLSHGVYPLWDKTWCFGVPNDFFLRRIGDVNPLLFLMVCFKWIGIPSTTAYLIFIGFYYFLAGLGFYLVTRYLLDGRFYAFIAYILFLFSSWGSEVFYNYIIIIFVPIVWFFYFLLLFYRRQQKGYLLGLCLCVGIIMTTYIPFLFIIILFLLTCSYVLLYGRSFIGFVNNAFAFFNKNSLFTAFCLIFLVVSCIPAVSFYKESKSGSFVVPGRHAASDTNSSEVTVGIDAVAAGDIVSHGYFDRIFDDQAHIDMGDIYIPYLFFLLLLITIPARANKLIFLLLFNILALSLITVTSASGVHRFLFEHVIFFKFIRQVYYFFWLAVLPMGILLSVTAFKLLLTAIHSSSRKTAWMVYIIVCHLAFALFLFGRLGVLAGAWVAIVISLVYFLIFFFYDRKISYPAGFGLFLLAVFLQSTQVYACLDRKLYGAYESAVEFSRTHIPLARVDKMPLYYSTHWFEVLVDYVDPAVLQDYLKPKFILYDNVLPYIDSPQFFKTFETTAAVKGNIAYVSKFESQPDDWQQNPAAGPQADIDPMLSGKLSVLYLDANTWVLKTHLSSSQFLVINDNYDKAWHAFINGHPARLLRANVSFKGLWLPSGESRIVLHFLTPKSYILRFGLILFFAGVFVYLLVLLKMERHDSIHA